MATQSQRPIAPSRQFATSRFYESDSPVLLLTVPTGCLSSGLEDREITEDEITARLIAVSNSVRMLGCGILLRIG